MLLLKLSKKLNITAALSLVFFFLAQVKASENKSENEYSEGYKSHTEVVGRCFDCFKGGCKEEQKRIMVIGTGHKLYDINYPNNFYLVDIRKEIEPDLLMDAGIGILPSQYVEKFDVVLFEGFVGYDRVKAFSNAYNLLRENGVFLVQTDTNEEKQQKAALSSFISVNLINIGGAEYTEYNDYIRSPMFWMGGSTVEFFVAKK